MLHEHVKALHVGLFAKDSVALAEWYRAVLGFKISLVLEREGRPPVYFLKLKDGSEIELQSKLFQPHIGFFVDDFDKAAEELASKGIALKNVRETSAGWKIGFFNDPEGNLMQVEGRPKGTPQVRYGKKEIYKAKTT